MAYPTFIGARYLKSKKKSSISAIGLIAIIGMALGVAALSVAIAISSGFEDEFTNKVLGVNAHVLVMKYGVDFTEYRDTMAKLEKTKGVRGMAPFVIQEMMIAKGDRTSGVLLKGIDPERVGQVLDVPKHIVAGSLDGLRVPGSKPPPPPSRSLGTLEQVERILDRDTESGDRGVRGRGDDSSKEAGAAAEKKEDPSKQTTPGIVLGRTLAENLDAKIGDVVQITTPLIGLDVLGWSPSDNTPRTLSFRVIGLFYAGFLEYDTKLAYVDYYQAQRFFNQGDSVTGIEMTVDDIHSAKEIASRIKIALGSGPYHIVDWQLLNEPLFRALKMQKVVITVVLAVIIGVAAFNIIATLVMMVFDKRKEIAYLKSMGATHSGIMGIFLYVGTVVALIGISIGIAVGFAAAFLLHKVGWPLDPKVYLIDHLPVRLEPIDFVITAVVSFVVCQIAVIFPSFSAAGLSPIDGGRKIRRNVPRRDSVVIKAWAVFFAIMGVGHFATSFLLFQGDPYGNLAIATWAVVGVLIGLLCVISAVGIFARHFGTLILLWINAVLIIGFIAAVFIGLGIDYLGGVAAGRDALLVWKYLPAHVTVVFAASLILDAVLLTWLPLRRLYRSQSKYFR